MFFSLWLYYILTTTFYNKQKNPRDKNIITGHKSVKKLIKSAKMSKKSELES